MKTQFPIFPLTKSLLKYVLGMKNSTFISYMNSIEDALIELSPKYNKTNKRFTEQEFIWICINDNKMKSETVITRIMFFYPEYKPEDYLNVANCYGLNGNNPFLNNKINRNQPE